MDDVDAGGWVQDLLKYEGSKYLKSYKNTANKKKIRFVGFGKHKSRDSSMLKDIRLCPPFS